MKPIIVRGRPLGQGGSPLVCVPVVGSTTDAVCAEARAMASLVQARDPAVPDLLEWRVDAFGLVVDAAAPSTTALVAAAAALREAAGDLPLLVTLRAAREGGRDHGLDDGARAALLVTLIETGVADLVDFETDADPAALDTLRAACRRRGVPLVLSAHHFSGTPSAGDMVAAFARAAALGADVAKLAVMPQDVRDVDSLLAATAEADRSLAIPLVSMAMGGIGVASRVVGSRYGSCITWASAGAPSAPGQLPLAELRRRLREELAR
ncbi:MAG: type I 3-dehydroquinate dehydratase [Gammaproteobacteria bacterium]